MSQQLLEQEMTVSQFLRNYGKQFTQVGKQYTDGLNGRCASISCVGTGFALILIW
jgi:hypothetical protein